MFVVSKALDVMKKKAACEGGSTADREAVGQLLQLATERFGSFTARALGAFVRCAAAFPGVLQPQQLRAWQAALLRHKPLDATAHDVSNMLLALGTLAESDGQLAAATSQPAAAHLLQHAVGLASSGRLSLLQDVSNTLYGAALLGLQPSAGQMQHLFSTVQQGLEQPLHRDDHKAVNQILLACAQLSDPQTTAGEAPKPDQDPFRRYYPGARLVDALLHRAISSGLGAQSTTLLVNACGRLRHRPTQDAWAALLAAFRRHAADMTPSGASAWLVGCAQLGVTPPAATIEACVAAVERQAGSVREAVNIAWALAMLEACDLPTWERLVAVAMQPGVFLADVAYAQFAQAHLLMQLRYGDVVPCPPQLLQRSHAAWQAQLLVEQQKQQQLQGRAVSQFEGLLAAGVAELAGDHAVVAGHIVHSRGGGASRCCRQM